MIPTLPAMTPGLMTDRTQLAEFRALCEGVSGVQLDDSAALHAYSVEHAEEFWRTLLTWTELPWSGSADVVLTGADVKTARFFPDVRLNYAEALLRPLPGVDDDGPALTSVHAQGPAEHLSRADLRSAVERTAGALATVGVAAGDRVVLIAPNSARTVVAALATAALGATLSTATPDMGPAALLGRFEQVDPAVLLIDRTGMAEGTAAQLIAGLPTLERVLLLDELPLPDSGRIPVQRLAELVTAAAPTGAPPRGGFRWERRPFDHPLFVMFSSGTTGPPKAMVHGAGGTLLEHVKEHRLHGDLRPADTLYFHTTTAWMMWNWQLSALAVGAHVVLYDGPVVGPETLWQLAAEHGVTVFGTSPAYLQLCEDSGYRPAARLDLSRLRSVLSTGAVLQDWQFDWVADAVGPMPLQSISGGTDIIGCFVLGSPERPVRRGRIQTRSLGMDVASVDDAGRELVGRVGDLVCRKPFPSRPIGFLRDPDGSRFHASYFADHPGMWTHGDLVDFDPDGSARMHGRSDGVLNIDGVRIGPSEIYTALREVPQIADAMAVEQRDPGRPGSSRMVLLVVLRAEAELAGGLDRTIRRTLREKASAAHVPSLVVPVPDLPLTHNGKRSERAARDAVNGDPVANLDALRNPESLAAIAAAVHGTRTAPTAGAEPMQLRETTTTGGPVQSGGDHASVVEAVTRLWCQVLDVEHAEPEDHFSDAGGTSRQVMSLLRRVSLEFGVDVPVQTFVEHPTLGALLQAIDGAPAALSPDVPLLREGRGSPLFFLGDAWGQVNSYAALAQRLDTTRPVYGVRLPLLDPEGRRLTIPQIAQQTMARVKGVQPSAPYSLAGYSFGGLVAYELAGLLEDAGERVAYLGLIDVLPPAAALTPAEAVARRCARNLDVVLSGALLRTLAGRVRARVRPAPATSEDEVFDGSWVIANAYRPRPYRGMVTYFRAEDRLPVVGNLLTAWRRVAPHLLVTDVPGYHSDTDGHRTGVLSELLRDRLAARISATLGG